MERMEQELQQYFALNVSRSALYLAVPALPDG